MAQQEQVRIYGRQITYDIVLPKESVWEFMIEFGETFAIPSSEGNMDFQAVDRYYVNAANVWHLEVTVPYYDESRLQQFIRSFCVARRLSFRDTEE